MPSPARLYKRFRAAGKMDAWILVSLGEHLRTPLKRPYRYDQGPEIHGRPRRVSLLVGEAQLAGCRKVWISGSLQWDAGIQ